MIFPFILNRFLKHIHFKKPELSLFQHRTGITRSDHAVKFWIKCWILVAKTMVMVFKDSFSKEDYDTLHDCLDNERKMLSLVILFYLYN